MDDRELLELAAKAAGIEGSVRQFQTTYSNEMNIGIGKNRWNPLTGDGDALRLAVRLRISIDPRYGAACAITNTDRAFIESYHGNDILPATRRAIVRAAAEIGRGM